MRLARKSSTLKSLYEIVAMAASPVHRRGYARLGIPERSFRKVPGLADLHSRASLGTFWTSLGHSGATFLPFWMYIEGVLSQSVNTFRARLCDMRWFEVV